jgi:hypothetical protein
LSIAGQAALSGPPGDLFQRHHLSEEFLARLRWTRQQRCAGRNIGDDPGLYADLADLTNARMTSERRLAATIGRCMAPCPRAVVLCCKPWTRVATLPQNT